MNLLFCSPTINEQTSGDQQDAGDHHVVRKSIFGDRSNALLDSFPHETVAHFHGIKETQERPDAGTKVRESCGACVEAVLALKDEREGCEEEVEETVEHGDVDAHEGRDGGEEQNFHRPNEGFLPELGLGFGLARGLSGVPCWVSGFFAQLFGFLFEDRGFEGFFENEPAGYHDDAAGHRDDPECPAPVCFLHEEAAGDGSGEWVSVMRLLRMEMWKMGS